MSDVPTGNVYDKYRARNPIERMLVGGFLRSLDSLLPEEPPAIVLEIGVGEGEIATRLRSRYPQATVVGLDLPDPEFVGEWSERQLLGVFGYAERLPLPDGSADLVLAIEVLEHLVDPEAALAEMARVARDRVVLSVPWEPVWRMANIARGKYLSALGNTPGHLQHWGRRRFVWLVGEYFDVQAVRRPFPWTMVAARARP